MVNHPDHEGNTPLHLACIKQLRFNCLKLVELLLTRGADVYASNNLGNTPLMELWGPRSVKDRDLFRKAGPRADVIQVLVTYGADLNNRYKDGSTPLHRSLQQFRVEPSEFLIKHGADVHARDRNGKSPLDVVKSWKMFPEDRERLQELLIHYGVGSSVSETKDVGCDTRAEASVSEN